MFAKIVSIVTTNKVAILAEGILTGAALLGLAIIGAGKLNQNNVSESAPTIVENDIPTGN